MLNDSSAAERAETPHTTNADLRRRADSLIKNQSINPQSRAVIRYALETNDPWLAELVRRADAGENLFDAVADLSQTPSIEFTADLPVEDKVEALAEIICLYGDDPGRPRCWS